MMLWTVRSFLALAVICGTLHLLPVAADSGHTIPSHLLECYQNEDLYHRENRLPATMPVVVSLLQAIEDSPGFTMDARSFALSLIHMFRVDGIERDPEVVASESTPFGLTGQQYYKHNVLLRNLIPRSSFLFPNDTLNDVQKCSLHFMMSNSLDKIERGDESRTCNSISGYRAPASRRQRRDVNDDTTAEEEDDATIDDDATAAGDDFGTEPVSGEPNHLDPADAADPATDPAADPTADAAPEATPGAAPSQEKTPTADPEPEAEIVVQPGDMGGGGGGGAADQKGKLIWGMDGAGPVGSGKLRAGPERATYVESQCPVENGVVYTRWGSVQLGTLLAGIAAGFETQTVAIKNIRTSSTTSSRTINGLSDTLEIDNRYAATLAGDLAEVTMIRGPKNTVTVGASGNWNSTQAQHWYFIKEINEMTDAEIRGGLDGLIMAHHVKDWASKAEGALRLSTILERYFSTRGVFDEEYRACERQNHYKDVAQSDTLREQTTSFVSALYESTPTSPIITSVGLSNYATDAVEALDKTVRASSQMEANCLVSSQPSPRAEKDLYIEPKLNLIFVVDCQWPYEFINPTLQSVAEEINLHPIGSMITVVGAATHEIVFNSSERIFAFSENVIQNETTYRQNSPGMKLKDLLDNYLRDYFTNQLENEEIDKESDVRSNVVVLMPYVNYDIPSSEIRDIENLLNEYRKYFPDVVFLFFVSQKKDSFKILVEDYEKDIIEFPYNSGNPTTDSWDLIQRLKTVPRRIANPSCGPNWKTGKYDTVRIYETIPNKHIALYRINPKYLFGVGSETIKIQEQNKGTVTVCHSRTDETPQDDDDSDEKNDNSQCESISGSEIEIKLNNPCSGSSSYITCNPLYISIEVTDSKMNCVEKATCKDPDDVAVEISHNNLTCGVAALRSPITYAVALILMISKILVTG